MWAADDGYGGGGAIGRQGRRLTTDPAGAARSVVKVGG
jgi:hypothetical protein